MDHAISFDDTICGNLKLALEKEWIETNGLGAYASSTIINANTRRYHGLLVASADETTQRSLFLSKLEEQVLIGDDAYSLSCNIYPDAINPTGFMYLREFRLDPFPVFIYQLDDVILEKKIFLVHGQNTVGISYAIIGGASEIMLKVRPLVAFRSYHELLKKNKKIQTTYTVRDRSVIYQAYPDMDPIYFSHDGLMIEGTALWYYDFNYVREKERGFDANEDLFNPFEITYIVTDKKSIFLTCSLDSEPVTNIYELEYAEKKRRASLISEYQKTHSSAGSLHVLPDAYQLLLQSSAHFLIKKNETIDGILSGYPWLEERLRDSFIALPGLTLVTGRYDVARNIFKRYIGYLQKGELPNYISEETSLPVYNSFEPALWFFYAVYKYIQYTNDLYFVADELYEAMRQCIQYFFTNTSKHVYVDSDNLLCTVNDHVYGAWKEKSADKYYIRSRVGKLVEINALWYLSMKVLEYVAHACKEERDFFRYHDLSLRIKESFLCTFWNTHKNCLYDSEYEGERSDAIRPYQLIAVSLPSDLLDFTSQRMVVETIERELLTMFGLRSLSTLDATYTGTYSGDWYSRDVAYHQGCVWPWFFGFYLDAYVKTNSDNETCTEACKVLLKALFHHEVTDGGIGFISEVFDGDFPHKSRGAMAYAASVAEVMRVYHEHILFRKTFSTQMALRTT
jgi:predicted glycogen debranching enzyme